MEKKWIELMERKETWGNMLDRVVSDSVSLGKMVQIEGMCADFHRKETADPCNLLPTSISTQMASHITAQTSYLCAGVNSLTLSPPPSSDHPSPDIFSSIQFTSSH